MTRRVLLIFVVILCIFSTSCSLNNSSDNITSFLFPTDGVVIDEAGDIQLSTSLEGNRFSYVALQLWTEIPSLHIMNISTATEGKQTGLYMHKLETGCYNLILKANSNKKDEAVSVRVFLIKGRSYTYSYDVKELGEKSALVSDFKFKMN